MIVICVELNMYVTGGERSDYQPGVKLMPHG